MISFIKNLHNDFFNLPCSFNRTESDFQLIMGAHDRTAFSESSRQLRGVGKLFIHPKYSDETIENDIALVKLSAPVAFTDEVSPICLPTRETRVREVCVAIGWGQLYEYGRKCSRYYNLQSIIGVLVSFIID